MPFRYIFLALIVRQFVANVVAVPQSTRTFCDPFRGEFCVSLSECTYFADLLNQSPTPRPIHVIRAYQCGFNHDMSPKVCCTHPPSQSNKSFAKNKKDEGFKNLNLLPKNCGAISVGFRITQGTEADLMEFPWMALLVYYSDHYLDFHCAGTLINEKYVLTAAHCVTDHVVVGVRLGEHDVHTTKDCDKITGICSPPVQDFFIENIIRHPEYNRRNFVNDIALIRLATTANLTYENAKPVCLPLGEHARSALYGKYAVITGWGVTETGSKSVQLLKSQIPIRNIHYCRQIYRGRLLIAKKQLCAGGNGGKNSCRGDSGGPLMMISSDDGEPKFVQYGIVSYGVRWCRKGSFPQIYTRVGGYTQWILENLRP